MVRRRREQAPALRWGSFACAQDDIFRGGLPRFGEAALMLLVSMLSDSEHPMYPEHS